MNTTLNFDEFYLESKFKEIQYHIADKQRLITLDYGGADSKTSLEKSLLPMNESINIFCLWSGTRESMRPKIIGHLHSKAELNCLKFELYCRNRDLIVSHFALNALSRSEKLAVSTFSITPSYMAQPAIRWISDNLKIIPVSFNPYNGRFDDR